MDAPVESFLRFEAAKNYKKLFFMKSKNFSFFSNAYNFSSKRSFLTNQGLYSSTLLSLYFRHDSLKMGLYLYTIARVKICEYNISTKCIPTLLRLLV